MVTARSETIRIASHDGVELLGDLVVPDAGGPVPAVVLLHGGAFVKGSRSSYGRWARFLAANGVASLAADYRLATPGRSTWPAALIDAKAAVRRLRHGAGEWGIDVDRIGVLGGSAGGTLAAMVALTAGDPRFHSPDEALVGIDDRVSVAVPMAGLFDLIAGWQHDRGSRAPDDRPLEAYLGSDPVTTAADRARWIEASPFTHVAADRAGDVRWLVAWGTADRVSPPDTQSEPFVTALEAAGALVRTVVLEGAPHFWYMEGEVDATNPYAELVGRRLLTFLDAWAGW